MREFKFGATVSKEKVEHRARGACARLPLLHFFHRNKDIATEIVERVTDNRQRSWPVCRARVFLLSCPQWGVPSVSWDAVEVEAEFKSTQASSLIVSMLCEPYGIYFSASK